MMIDCETCVMRDLACTECIVSYLAPPVARTPDLDAAEQEAVRVLAASGLVKPLRLVEAAPRHPMEPPRPTRRGVRSA